MSSLEKRALCKARKDKVGRSSEAQPGEVVPGSGGTSASVEAKLGQCSVKDVAGGISAAGQQVELDRKKFWGYILGVGSFHEQQALSQVANMTGMGLLCKSLSLHGFDRLPSWELC